MKHCNVEMEIVDQHTTRGSYYRFTGEEELHSETYMCPICREEITVEYNPPID